MSIDVSDYVDTDRYPLVNGGAGQDVLVAEFRYDIAIRADALVD